MEDKKLIYFTSYSLNEFDVTLFFPKMKEIALESKVTCWPDNVISFAAVDLNKITVTEKR